MLYYMLASTVGVEPTSMGCRLLAGIAYGIGYPTTGLHSHLSYVQRLATVLPKYDVLGQS
jgi:hypothetical protein